MRSTSLATGAHSALAVSALGDVASALRRWDFWSTLAWFDIRGRYRRTLIGPFWSVLNSVVFIAILATVYARLWKLELTAFLPYVAAGFFVWTFLATTVGECCSIFHGNAETLKTMPLPPLAFVLRVLTRNAIVFAHNILVYAGIALACGVSLATAWLALPGLLLVAFTALGLGAAVAMVCARFRDIEQIVQSAMQMLFFVSPILWQEKLLPAHASGLADWNPVVHLLRVVRDPLLGTAPVPAAFGPACLVAAVALGLGAAAYARFRSRLMFWL